MKTKYIYRAVKRRVSNKQEKLALNLHDFIKER
jgi:hypothetical protein